MFSSLNEITLLSTIYIVFFPYENLYSSRNCLKAEGMKLQAIYEPISKYIEIFEVAVAILMHARRSGFKNLKY